MGSEVCFGGAFWVCVGRQVEAEHTSRGADAPRGASSSTQHAPRKAQIPIMSADAPVGFIGLGIMGDGSESARDGHGVAPSFVSMPCARVVTPRFC